jgi:tetratricopeptide (TPR) repeat protein
MARMLQAVQAAESRGELATAQGLTRLASQFPTSASLQMFVAQRLAAIDPAAASQVARRAMDIDQADADAARLASQLFMAIGRWNDMLDAAQAWRQRDRSASADPDIAIAEAQLQLGRPDRAIRALATHADRASGAPDAPGSVPVLDTYARSLISAGREREARALLTPLLSEHATIRSNTWIGIAARDLPRLDSSRRWLELVQPHIPADATDEHLAAAIALTMLADRFPDKGTELLADARSTLSDLVSGPGSASASAWEALGIVHHRLGDPADAETAYRRALELDESRTISLNNLANIVAQTYGDLDEALVLATRAVGAGTSDPAHLSTLATIQRDVAHQRSLEGNHAQARDLYRAAADTYGLLASLNPADPSPSVQRAQALWNAGDAAAAAAEYERVLERRGLPPDVDAALRNNLAMALRASARGPSDLERARALVHDALRVGERAAFYHTLGWIELDLQHYAEAERAFRAAHDRAAAEHLPLPTAALGLASALVNGNDEARREAARIFDTVSDDVGPEYQERMEQVRAALAAAGPP